MNNLELWNKVRAVPETAQKKITGGRLNGKTDINPMWRIKVLTEQFGPCGFGWRYLITDKWLEAGANDEMAAFVNVNLYIKVGDAWSEAIPGTGGSMFIAKEKSGPYTSDECYKMALTDALSVACKALGIGADIYWSGDNSKYDKPAEAPKQANDRIDTVQVNILKRECVGLDGKPDREQIDRLKAVYTRYGYTKAEEIKVQDFEKIKREFIESALPFDVNEHE